MQPECVVGQLARLLDGERHVRDLVPDDLHRRQRLSKLRPVGRILDRQLEAPLR